MTHLDAVTRTVLALAFPERWNRPPLDDDTDPALVLRALKANKIPLLSLTPAGLALAPACRDSLSFRQGLEQAREAFAHYRREFAEISAALEQAGLPHLLMKSAGPFPYESDNFDILIPHDRRRAVDLALRPLGFVPQHHYREDWKFIYKRFQGGRLQSIAHLHEEVSWGVEAFLDRTGLWQRAQASPDDPGFRVPSPEDCFLITMAHGVYENDRIKLGDLLKVHLALRRADGRLDWHLMEHVARQMGWQDGYEWILATLRALEHGLWGASLLDEPLAAGSIRPAPADAVTGRVAAAASFPVPLGRRFSKWLFLRKLMRSTPLPRLPGKLAGFLRDGMEAFWPLPLHRSLVIAVSGMDGAGKSTAIEVLRQLCTDLELSHEVVWLRAGNSDLMQALNRALRRVLGAWLKRTTNDRQRESGPPTGVQPERRINHRGLATLWYWLALSELLLRTRLTLCRGRLRRRVVICDRYLLDSLVDLVIRCDRRESIGDLARRAPGRWFPHPDLGIVLQVEAEAAFARKEQEFTREQMSVRARLYVEAVEAGGVVAIDTTAGKAATFARLTTAFLERYSPPSTGEESVVSV